MERLCSDLSVMHPLGRAVDAVAIRAAGDCSAVSCMPKHINGEGHGDYDVWPTQAYFSFN